MQHGTGMPPGEDLSTATRLKGPARASTRSCDVHFKWVHGINVELHLKEARFIRSRWPRRHRQALRQLGQLQDASSARLRNAAMRGYGC